jgi:hypothetical protein
MKKKKQVARHVSSVREEALPLGQTAKIPEMKPITIQWKPDFIEEAVFITVKHLEEAGDAEKIGDFHQQKDLIYEKVPKLEQNARFQEFYTKQFDILGLNSFFSNVFEEFPLLNDSHLKILGRRAWSRKEEGVELYVHAGVKSMIVKLQTLRMEHHQTLATYLRHELLHISDMLDPIFEYSPNPNLGGTNEVEDNLIRDRFRVLWDLYVASRLQKRGHDVLASFEKQRASLEKAFSTWHEKDRGRIFKATVGGEAWTQAGLLDMASGRTVAQEPRLTAEKCSLCGFPTRDEMTDWTGNDAPGVVERICQDRPDWTSELKTCRQCFEMYRAMRGAVAS